MKMTQNLPMYEEIVQGNPSYGHMPRAMTRQDSTEDGIVKRIGAAVSQGLISKEVGAYLVETLLANGELYEGDEMDGSFAMDSMEPPKRMPMPNNVFPNSLLDY
jgi:hypothetical protein